MKEINQNKTETGITRVINNNTFKTSKRLKFISINEGYIYVGNQKLSLIIENDEHSLDSYSFIKSCKDNIIDGLINMAIRQIRKKYFYTNVGNIMEIDLNNNRILFLESNFKIIRMINESNVLKYNDNNFVKIGEWSDIEIFIDKEMFNSFQSVMDIDNFLEILNSALFENDCFRFMSYNKRKIFYNIKISKQRYNIACTGNELLVEVLK